MRQREARSADCLQKVEEAGADPLIDPQRRCGLASRPLSSDPMKLTLDSRPPGAPRPVLSPQPLLHHAHYGGELNAAQLHPHTDHPSLPLQL